MEEVVAARDAQAGWGALVQVALANLDVVLQEARGALEGLPQHLLAELQAVQKRLHPRPWCSAPAAPLGTSMPVRSSLAAGMPLEAASQLCAADSASGEEVARTRQVMCMAAACPSCPWRCLCTCF